MLVTAPSGWVAEVGTPAVADGFVQYEYKVWSSLASKEAGDSYILWNNHKSQFRETHQRIKRGPGNGFMWRPNHALPQATIEITDFDRFEKLQRRRYARRGSLLAWDIVGGGTVAPYVFPAYDGTPEALDPQWERELHTVPLDDQITESVLAYLARANATGLRGDRRGTTYNLQVSAGAGDMYATLNDAFTFDGPDNQVYRNSVDANREGSGARFTGGPPQGYTINSATMQMWTGSVGGFNDMGSTIYAEDVNAAVDFTASATLWGRTRTAASTTWLATGLTASAFATSPSVAAPVQTVVSRAGYSGTIMMLVLGNLGADLYWAGDAYDTSSAHAAKLDIDASASIVQGPARATVDEPQLIYLHLGEASAMNIRLRHRTTTYTGDALITIGTTSGILRIQNAPIWLYPSEASDTDIKLRPWGTVSAAAVVNPLTIAITVVTTVSRVFVVGWTRAFTATGTVTVPRVVNWTRAISVATSVLVPRVVNWVRAVNVVTSVLVPRSVAHTVPTITATTTTTVVRSVLKTIASTVTASVSRVLSVLKPIAASSTVSVTVPRTVGHLVAITTATTTTVIRSVLKPIAITATTSVTRVRSVLKPIAITVTSAVTVPRVVNWVRSITVTTSVLVPRVVGHIVAITVTTTTTVAATRAFLRTFSITVTTSTTVARSVSHAITLTGGVAVTVVRSIAHVVPLITTALTTTVPRVIGHSVPITANTALSVVRSIGHRVGLLVGVVLDALRTFLPAAGVPQPISLQGRWAPDVEGSGRWAASVALEGRISNVAASGRWAPDAIIDGRWAPSVPLEGVAE